MLREAPFRWIVGPPHWRPVYVPGPNESRPSNRLPMPPLASRGCTISRRVHSRWAIAVCPMERRLFPVPFRSDRCHERAVYRSDRQLISRRNILVREHTRTTVECHNPRISHRRYLLGRSNRILLSFEGESPRVLHRSCRSWLSSRPHAIAAASRKKSSWSALLDGEVTYIAS